jgi:hypothetical protein
VADELLNRATRALRATTKPNPHGMEAMLVRVSHRRGAWSNVRWRAAAYALAATFVGVGAWARVTGRLPAALGNASAPQAPFATSAQATRTAEKRDRGTPAQLAPLAPSDEALAPITSAEPIPTATTAPRVSAVDERHSPQRSLNQAPSTIPSASVAAARPAVNVDELYREAHQAHFVRGDASAALAAWDRYLAAAGPGARMLVEAQYNRAITLARLGRTAEALAALRPFANGEYGNYRRDEARALIESLASRHP